MCIRSSNDSHTLRNEDITFQNQNHVNMHDSYITVCFGEVSVICFQFLSSYITCFFLLIVLVFRMIMTLNYYPSQCQLALLMILHQQMWTTHRHNNNMILHQQKLGIHTNNNNKSKHCWFDFFLFLIFFCLCKSL